MSEFSLHYGGTDLQLEQSKTPIGVWARFRKAGDMRSAIAIALSVRSVTVAMLVAASCTACTHLQTNPTGDVPSVAAGAPAGAGAQRGLSYPLPMVQYNLKITRMLESCPLGTAPARFRVKVEASERHVAGERFEVDYQAMSSIMKTTGFDISYHESGTIKTINATAQDQTGTVLTNIARIGLSVASAAAGSPAGLRVAPFSNERAAEFSAMGINRRSSEHVPQITLHCTPAAEAALLELSTKTEEVTALTRDIEQLVSDITRLSAVASLEVMSELDKAELSEKTHALMRKEATLRTHLARIAELQAMLSATEELAWPDQAGDIPAHQGFRAPTNASLEKLAKLFEIHVDGVRMNPQPDMRQAQVLCGADENPMPAALCLSRIGSLNLALIATVAEPAHPTTTDDPRLNSAVVPHGDRRWARGIFVREPVEARLVICRAPASPDRMGCDDQSRPVLLDEPVIAPQLGRLRFLPFRSRPFEDNHIQLSVRANGFIEQFSYGEESSAAAASGALADIAERTQTALEAMETERRSDIQFVRDSRTYERNEIAAGRAEEVAQLTHQVNLLKGQSDVLAAQLALAAANETTQYAAEKARIDAEVQLLQSRIARLKAANEMAAMNAN
ncbi:MAG TPA: hypothetical protein VEW71_07575 [Allosphingosinicella sp.]|nr:hypothetical protein [Allosphingosinicella sp.]